MGFLSSISSDSNEQILRTAKEYLPANIHLISACNNWQITADNSNVKLKFGLRSSQQSPHTKSPDGGACTSALLKILYGYEKNDQEKGMPKYVSLLEEVRKMLRDKSYTQVPQLSSSRPIDEDEEFRIIPKDFKEGVGRRRALIIGISYKGTAKEIPGCQNDALNMKYFLMTVHGFQEDDITILIDDREHLEPTQENIKIAMHRFSFGLKAGDAAFFCFAGHGLVRPDGHNQALMPTDHNHKEANTVPDREIFRLMLLPLPKGVQLTALVDCCHSGNMFDLPFHYVTEAEVAAEKEDEYYHLDTQKKSTDLKDVKFNHLMAARLERRRIAASKSIPGIEKSDLEKIFLRPSKAWQQQGRPNANKNMSSSTHSIGSVGSTGGGSRWKKKFNLLGSSDHGLSNDYVMMDFANGEKKNRNKYQASLDNSQRSYGSSASRAKRPSIGNGLRRMSSNKSLTSCGSGMSLSSMGGGARRMKRQSIHKSDGGLDDYRRRPRNSMANSSHSRNNMGMANSTHSRTNSTWGEVKGPNRPLKSNIFDLSMSAHSRNSTSGPGSIRPRRNSSLGLSMSAHGPTNTSGGRSDRRNSAFDLSTSAHSRNSTSGLGNRQRRRNSSFDLSASAHNQTGETAGPLKTSGALTRKMRRSSMFDLTQSAHSRNSVSGPAKSQGGGSLGRRRSRNSMHDLSQSAHSGRSHGGAANAEFSLRRQPRRGSVNSVLSRLSAAVGLEERINLVRDSCENSYVSSKNHHGGQKRMPRRDSMNSVRSQISNTQPEERIKMARESCNNSYVSARSSESPARRPRRGKKDDIIATQSGHSTASDYSSGYSSFGGDDDESDTSFDVDSFMDDQDVSISDLSDIMVPLGGGENGKQISLSDFPDIVVPLKDPLQNFDGSISDFPDIEVPLAGYDDPENTPVVDLKNPLQDFDGSFSKLPDIEVPLAGFADSGNEPAVDLKDPSKNFDGIISNFPDIQVPLPGYDDSGSTLGFELDLSEGDDNDSVVSDVTEATDFKKPTSSRNRKKPNKKGILVPSRAFQEESEEEDLVKLNRREHRSNLRMVRSESKGSLYSSGSHSRSSFASKLLRTISKQNIKDDDKGSISEKMLSPETIKKNARSKNRSDANGHGKLKRVGSQRSILSEQTDISDYLDSSVLSGMSNHKRKKKTKKKSEKNERTKRSEKKKKKRKKKEKNEDDVTDTCDDKSAVSARIVNALSGSNRKMNSDTDEDLWEGVLRRSRNNGSLFDDEVPTHITKSEASFAVKLIKSLSSRSLKGLEDETPPPPPPPPPPPREPGDKRNSLLLSRQDSRRSVRSKSRERRGRKQLTRVGSQRSISELSDVGDYLPIDLSESVHSKTKKKKKKSEKKDNLVKKSSSSKKSKKKKEKKDKEDGTSTIGDDDESVYSTEPLKSDDGGNSGTSFPKERRSSLLLSRHDSRRSMRSESSDYLPMDLSESMHSTARRRKHKSEKKSSKERDSSVSIEDDEISILSENTSASKASKKKNKEKKSSKKKKDKKSSAVSVNDDDGGVSVTSAKTSKSKASKSKSSKREKEPKARRKVLKSKASSTSIDSKVSKKKNKANQKASSTCSSSLSVDSFSSTDSEESAKPTNFRMKADQRSLLPIDDDSMSSDELERGKQKDELNDSTHSKRRGGSIKSIISNILSPSAQSKRKTRQ